MADRPEVEKLGYALAKQVPDMERGFIIQTSYGDLTVDADDAQRFASLAQAMLSEKLARARGASHIKHAPGPWITIDGQSLDVLAAYHRQMASLFAVLEQRPEMDLNTSQLCSIGRDLAGSAHSQIRVMRSASKSEVSA